MQDGKAEKTGKAQGIVIDRDICRECFTCANNCNSRALSVIGRDYSVSGLLREIKKDEVFFRNSGGGVTFSGGEPLMHIDDAMLELYHGVKASGISIGVDTSGYISPEGLEKMYPLVDFFLWDIKCMDARKHKKFTGVDNRIILNNLHFVSEMNRPVYLRCPMITGFNDSDADLRQICLYAAGIRSLVEIDLLPLHHLGKARYLQLGLEYPLDDTCPPGDEVMEEKRKLVESYGFVCKITG